MAKPGGAVLLGEAIEMLRSIEGDDGLNVLDMQLNLGVVLRGTGDLDGAEQIYLDTLPRWRAALGVCRGAALPADDPTIQRAQEVLQTCLADLDRQSKPEPLAAPHPTEAGPERDPREVAGLDRP